MNLAMCEPPERGKWKALYKAAMVEADSTNSPNRLAEATKVIVERAGDLFEAGEREFR